MLVKTPAYQSRCSKAVGGTADHALLSGYNDKAILGADGHPLQSSTRGGKKTEIPGNAHLGGATDTPLRTGSATREFLQLFFLVAQIHVI